MKEIDRRSVLTGIICGAAVATVGLAVMPKAAKSLPLGAVKADAVKPEGLVEEARVTVSRASAPSPSPSSLALLVA